MIDGLVIPPDTRARQRLASDPGASVWVSANAGAGKTKVLTDRVIRLLLAGTAPSRILCLTFTKAAAAEMTIRVFAKLGEWVTLDDAALAKSLEELTGERPPATARIRARRLFAQAVETPGGLKIETIHAFCERILHLVPFEAEVPPSFTVLDDDQNAELLAEARAGILRRTVLRDGEAADLARAIDVAGSYRTGEQLTALIDGAVLDSRIPGSAEEVDAACADLAAAFGLRPGETPETVLREITEDGIAPSDWPALAEEIARTGKVKDREVADTLRLAAGAGGLAARKDYYWPVFFTKEGPPKKAVVTKGVAAGIQERLAEEQARLWPLDDRLKAAETVERTWALCRLAAAIRADAEALKRQRDALDFGDLIRKTVALLESGAAPWVLYRLDRGIDHVLVDEAQDTNPDQWRILRLLTADFTAGEGRALPRPRTIFAVGDPKQSIYSFQGADPRLFEESRRHWRGGHAQARLRFDDVRLDLSFRSASAILNTVDQTFAIESHYRGLSFEDAAPGTRHTSARPSAPGHVEIWPTEVPSAKPEDPDAWELPVDQIEPNAPAIVVAGRVAQAIRHWTSVPDPATGRRFRPGEILILARKRGPAFFATIRALKSAGIPVAGADRIDINDQIAVQDLLAAGGAALLPENDLVLAAALKSPLVGLDDEDLLRIAESRGEGVSLAAALEAAAPHDPGARIGRDALARWRDLARRHGPFGFYATLLGPDGGRRRLVERLGGEAADAIDVFLGRAAADERAPECTSLTAFLARFEASAHVVRRDPEAAGNEVRVMTVHGAKGLEAPLVILLDGCEVGGEDPSLIPVALPGRSDALPVWALGSRSDCAGVAAARRELRDRALEEHNRLLYVALTRARDRLVIAPFVGARGERPESWCGMVRRGFAEGTRALVRTEMPHGPADLWQEAGDAAIELAGAATVLPPDVPAWLGEPVPAEPETRPPLRPSAAAGAADRPDSRRIRAPTRQAARRHGILLHGLVEALAPLPPEEACARASRILAARAPGLDRPASDGIIAAALRVLSHPDLAPLFGPGSRGEVDIAGRIGPPGRERAVVGRIDRLAIRPGEVLVADLKTGAPSPDGHVPPAYTRQLALYRALLALIHPDRPVRAFLVWTEGPRIVELSASALDAELPLALAALP